MDGFIDTMENVLEPLGLMTGEYAVGKRLIVGGILGGFVVTWLKPEIMFEKGTGKPRPWSLITSDKTCGNPTPLPWVIGPFVGAIILGVFV